MARTYIDIDDDACAVVMERYELRTKQDAVNFALRELAGAMSVKAALAMRGDGWEGDLDALRGGHVDRS